MVKKRSEELQRQKAVELGQENARLYPKVQNWCRHLQIRMVSSGLLAEWYRLPIGSLKIICEYAPASGMQGGQLRDIATHFIVNNCRGCQFREGADIDNIGHIILTEWEEVQQRLQTEQEQTNAVKARLYELVSGNLTEALYQEEITKQSILNLVALLDKQTEHIEAAKKLLQASKIAAELFIDVAIEVICSHFPDPEHGRDCINTIRSLGQQTGQIPEVAFIAAQRCLAENHHADDVCALIGDYVVQCNFVPKAELVDAIVGMQKPSFALFSDEDNHREYPGSLYALEEIGKRDLNILVDSLKRRLDSNAKHTRINTAHIIQSLIDTFPELVLKLIEALIDSLELDDDPYMDSADTAACETLAAIYVRHPKKTQKALATGYQRASEEAKVLIYRVYNKIVRGASTYGSPIGSQSLYINCIPHIIPLLIQAISGRFPLEVKKTAANTLKYVSDKHPNALVKHLDVLLGTLANLAQEKVSVANTTYPGVFELQYSNIISSLVNTLKAICDLNFHLVFNKLKDIFPNLDSNKAHLAEYKSTLVFLYGSLGKHHDLIPEIIPDIYDILLDFESVLVRGSAVKAVSKILKQRAEVIPQNMLDLIVMYLNDQYIYVHQSAVEAMQYVHPNSLEEAREITGRLLNLDQAYKKDPYFRQDILKALIHVTRDYSDLLTKFTLPVVVQHAQIHEQDLAEESLEFFWGILSHIPEEFTAIFAREVLAFIGRNNPEFNSDKPSLVLKLYKFPKNAIVDNLSVFKETVSKKAQDQPWDAIRLIKVLSYFELYGEAVELAQKIVVTQPQTKRYEAVIQSAILVKGSAQIELLVTQGKIDEALNLLDEIASLEAKLHENTQTPDIRDIIAEDTVAQRIADRTS